MTEITKIAATRRTDSGDTSQRSSGPKTADALIYTGGGTITGIEIIDDGAEACAIALHDSVDNSGTEIVSAVSGGDGAMAGLVDIDVRFNTGLYADITTAGTVSYIVFYVPD
jgi:hypothetical protein